jgi:hypothetical protein
LYWHLLLLLLLLLMMMIVPFLPIVLYWYFVVVVVVGQWQAFVVKTEYTKNGMQCSIICGTTALILWRLFELCPAFCCSTDMWHQKILSLDLNRSKNIYHTKISIFLRGIYLCEDKIIQHHIICYIHQAWPQFSSSVRFHYFLIPSILPIFHSYLGRNYPTDCKFITVYFFDR